MTGQHSIEVLMTRQNQPLTGVTREIWSEKLHIIMIDLTDIAVVLKMYPQKKLELWKWDAISYFYKV